MTGIGMRNAAETTEEVLAQCRCDAGFPVNAVVFSGVAGGHRRTQIGDVAIPSRWTGDDGATWHAVDSEMLAAASQLSVMLERSCRVGGPLLRRRIVNLNREPQLHVGGDGASGDHNNGVAFPAIPAVFGPQPLAAPDFSHMFTGNFFQAVGRFLARGLVSNLTGLLRPANPAVDAVDQETAAAQQVTDAHGVPFLGIRGLSDGPGDPLKLPGYPITFFVYKQIAAHNAATVTQEFLRSWAR
jgi:Phosphorylase superfamily